jgi:peroxiredoxin
MRLTEVLGWGRMLGVAGCLLMASGKIVSAQDTQVKTYKVPVKGVPDNLTPADQRKPAPDFTLNDTQGRPVTLSEYKGKVVLLDFWATWCPGCQYEIPWYLEFEKKYKDKGLVVIGVAMDKEGLTVVQPYMQKLQMDYMVVLGNDDLLPQFGFKTLPATYLIDKNGNVAVAHMAMVDKDNFEGHIEELLK